jgi:hypothetical protein
MCPFCQEHDGKPCAVSERPNGRVACACGKHSWPNSAAYQESVRLQNLKIVGRVHTWTQSY